MDKFDWRKTINVNLVVLRFVGLWPAGYEVYKMDLYLLYSTFTSITIIGGHNLSQIVNIYYVYADLEALSGTIFIAATNIFAVVKRYFFIRNLKLIKKLFITLNTYQFRPTISRHLPLVNRSVRSWKTAYFSFCLIVYSNVTLWSIVPIINHWVKDHKLPFEAWYPFKTDLSPNYELAYVYQLICIWFITVSNLNLDTFIYAFMMFIGIQCDILIDDLKHLEDDKNFGRKLTNCIKHHEEILKFAKNSNDFFNYIILGQIATSTAALALAMFQLSLVDVSSGVAYTHVAYIFGMSAEIFWYCWFGNEVELKSAQIPYAVFESQWIGQSESAIKNIIILCQRCQKPIKITAINLFTLSLHTFIGILRSAWSYFAVLSTVNSK
ncbi:hypothetical protein Zmor_007661 [Zophobas morio]|uniref:Odorant receptor n=1 Tax=Zophobas morio TaxID=2755281 RepID=A0AA38IZL5_9CUCU|nr:hypothetical protein Zmor_007661 [Zophobas morio]